MVKVLVANENVDQVKQCCQYLSDNDQMLRTISANTGSETLDKYNKMKADILILNSHFSDIKSTEIVDRLSSIAEDCRSSNIIMTINTPKEQLAFVNTEKILGFYKPLDFDKMVNAIERIKSKNKYEELTDDYLNKLLYSMNIKVGSYQTEILKDAIKLCYTEPYLLGNFDEVLSKLSKKYQNLSEEQIRSVIRYLLDKLNRTKKLFLPLFPPFLARYSCIIL